MNKIKTFIGNKTYDTGAPILIGISCFIVRHGFRIWQTKTSQNFSFFGVRSKFKNCQTLRLS